MKTILTLVDHDAPVDVPFCLEHVPPRPLPGETGRRQGSEDEVCVECWGEQVLGPLLRMDPSLGVKRR